MSTLPRGQKLLAILPAVIVIFLLTPHPLHAQYVTTTVPAGTNPWAVAVNPVTNKIYVANYSTNNVTVIDGATNATITVTDPAAISPYAVAVDTMTNKIYVSNCGTCTSSTGNGSGSVTVIDGATNATTNLGLGFNPWALAINPVTNKIYVANCGIVAAVRARAT
jgi:DNA-binding beta-propeller fold protein YncE